MTKYDYRKSIILDIREWLQDNLDEIRDLDIEDAAEKLDDLLWTEDGITGNGGGWYDSEYMCEEYLCHNMDLLFEALFEFGEFEAQLLQTIRIHQQENTFACWADCTIRCYLLNGCVWEVLGKWYEENERSKEN